MKWFKHDTSALKDEKVQFAIEHFGLAGYGLYFGLMELVAEKIDAEHGPEGEFSWKFLKKFLCVSRPTIEKFCSVCSQRMEFQFEISNDGLKISFPNLLKRLDEYTEKSRHNRDKIPHKNKIREQEERIQKEDPAFVSSYVPRETNSEERIEPSPFEKDFHHLDRFNEFWEQYPERIERSRAIRIFSHTIQTTEQFQKLMVALGKYKKHLSLNAWKKALKPETFLMGWTDWLEWNEPATPETSKEKADQLIKNLKEIPA